MLFFMLFISGSASDISERRKIYFYFRAVLPRFFRLYRRGAERKTAKPFPVNSPGAFEITAHPEAPFA